METWWPHIVTCDFTDLALTWKDYDIPSEHRSVKELQLLYGSCLDLKGLRQFDGYFSEFVITSDLYGSCLDLKGLRLFNHHISFFGWSHYFTDLALTWKDYDSCSSASIFIRLNFFTLRILPWLERITTYNNCYKSHLWTPLSLRILPWLERITTSKLLLKFVKPPKELFNFTDLALTWKDYDTTFRLPKDISRTIALRILPWLERITTRNWLIQPLQFFLSLRILPWLERITTRN